MNNKTKTIVDVDPWLEPYRDKIDNREAIIDQNTARILGDNDIASFALGHLYYGLHRSRDGGWIFREWAPNATEIYLICQATKWQEQSMYKMTRLLGSSGDWELRLPAKTLNHLDHYKLKVYWDGGKGERLPSYVTYAIQDEKTKIFDAVVWDPDNKYDWDSPLDISSPKEELIYEVHVGMSGDREGISTYRQFVAEVLPRISDLGYNTIQLMAIQEHPYYGSFGYQVANFFAESSRFGTPDDLRFLIDSAHNLNIRVILDIVHSHSVKNENEGLGNFSGDHEQYFKKEVHPVWDSRLFDYGKSQVCHFLLSNIRYWMDEFRFDGFRFDGVTSMIYRNHGIGQNFISYDDYFTDNVDLDALTYLRLANQLIKEINPNAVSIAEDISALPGLAAPIDLVGGIGFDYRFNMGAPNIWSKLLKKRDEDWDMGSLFHELTSHRAEEKTINYAESHDQALVGDKTIIFQLLDREMYDHMDNLSQSLVVDRGIALHKIIRLLTSSTSCGGYLNFMGNEFGHPEWIDFPREGNGWSYKYARRQWNLVDNKALRYHFLNNFDRDMIHLIASLDIDDIGYVNIDNDKKIISFVRGDQLFVFNLSVNSYPDLRIPAPKKIYRIQLSSDEDEYGGFSRVDNNLNYEADIHREHSSVRIYLPSRTALVFKAQYYDLSTSPWL